MRQIKFRAWLPVGEWDEGGERQAYKMVGPDELAFEDYEPVSQLLSHCENLMQFTGLKDKNGKEIYEGDILKEVAARCNLYQVFGVPGGFAINQWQDERAKIRTFCEPLAHDQTSAYVQSQCEIIGNIHEHPHLLSAAQDSPLTKDELVRRQKDVDDYNQDAAEQRFYDAQSSPASDGGVE